MTDNDAAIIDALNHAAMIRKLRELIEEWRLEGLREREDFPDEYRKLARCSHQLHLIVEQFHPKLTSLADSRASLLRATICAILSATGKYPHDIPRLAKEALLKDNELLDVDNATKGQCLG